MIRDKLYGNHINVSDTHQVQEGSLAPFLNNLNEYSTCNYLYKEKRKGFFVSSSGVCNLQCPYCITNHPCENINLNKDDFSFRINPIFHKDMQCIKNYKNCPSLKKQIILV